MNQNRLLYVLFGVLFSIYCQAQAPKSQRFVLLEEFTSTTCGPCAGVNPTLHSMQTSNPDKFTSIYYHVNWPAPGDPMNLANPTETAARVGYYGVNAVPDGEIDGNYWNGNPYNLTINTINARYAMPSPMEIDLQHRLSAGNDSIYLTMLIKATESIPLGNIYAHNVVIEKHIHFNTAPGSNGEKDFYNVMKKMCPGSGGTKINKALAAGDYQIIETSWKLANVYTISELAAVGFVQNNANKEVFQTVNSSTDAVTPLYANDAEILSIEKTSPTNCMGIVSPRVVVRNNGSSPVTSLKIDYEVNGGTPQSFIWNGNLGLLERASIDLPEYNFAVVADNSLKVFINQINGLNDEYKKNDTLTMDIAESINSDNVVNVWIKTDNNPQETTWKILNSNGDVVGSGGPYSTAGTLVKEVVTLPTEAECYRFYMLDAGSNGLCCDNGMGFFTFFYGNNKVIAEGTKFGAEVLAQFDVGSGVGINETNLNPSLSITPNPADAMVFVHVLLNNAAGAVLNIYDLRGSLVYTTKIGAENGQPQVLDLDLSGLSKGMYIAEVIGAGKTLREKFTLK